MSKYMPKGAARHVQGVNVYLITKMHLRLNALIEKTTMTSWTKKFCNTASGWTKFCPLQQDCPKGQVYAFSV